MSRPILDQPSLLYTDAIRQNADLFPSKSAVVCAGKRLTWAELNDRTNRVANALVSTGLNRGDKVCLVMNSSIDMFETMWGVIKAGGVVVPLNVMMASDSLAVTVNDSRASIIFADTSTCESVEAVLTELERIDSDRRFLFGEARPGWKSAEQLIDGGSKTEPSIEVDGSDSMNIIYSSGSTGEPKGIEHSHFARHIYSLGFGPGLRMTKESVAICSTPLYTNGTWITMLPAVYFGGTTVLMQKFKAEEFFRLVEQERCTHAFMVPTQYIVLSEFENSEEYDRGSMEALLTGGQAISDKTLDRIATLFSNARIYECYGLTEGFITLASPEDKALPGKKRTVGLPMFLGETAIIDDDGSEVETGTVGEIAGYGPALMKGYFRKERLTEGLIWRDPLGRSFLRSGDLGFKDDDGYLYIVGRLKDMIKSGGVNIYASDIEDVFMQHDAVVEVAAIGVPHEKWVETPVLLAIVRKDSDITEEELLEWGNQRLGKWQRVSKVEFRDDFPRATHDKVLKRELRAPYWP